ncbi:HNH endonuclease [Candidatus Pacearchaeota archaeon]|nr:HNH endonuclease [Candidatus Pacearchaeota archaeon]
MNKSNQYIIHAYELGYRVLPCGCVESPRGKRRKVRKSTSGYPRFNVKLEGKAVQVEVHRLAAFQLFRHEVFAEGLVVRHLNDEKNDNRHVNLKLGTHSENLQDSYRNGIRKRKMNTDITFLLDRSGSMNPLINDTIGGFNSLIEEQRVADGEATVTLCQFDSEFQVDYEGVNLADVKALDNKSYVPRGSTALLDALGRTIIMTEARLNGASADNMIVVIVTDGQENDSREFKRDQVKTLVEAHPDWSFVFTGANMDAIGEGSSFGLSGAAASGCMNYNSTSEGTQTMYSTVSQSMLRSRSTGERVSFTDKERDANS